MFLGRPLFAGFPNQHIVISAADDFFQPCWRPPQTRAQVRMLLHRKGEFMVAGNYVLLQDAKPSGGDVICGTLPLLVTFFAAIASIKPSHGLLRKEYLHENPHSWTFQPQSFRPWPRLHGHVGVLLRTR